MQGLIHTGAWWAPFLMLAASITAIWWASKKLFEHLFTVLFLMTNSRDFSAAAVFVFLYPGIFLHEFSHWIVAYILGLRPSKFTLKPKITRNSLKMGSVTIRSGGAIADSIVGVAPFVTGSIALVSIGYLMFPLGESNNLFRWLKAVPSTPDFLIWLYLIVVVSNAMLPSESDRKPWTTVVIYLAMVAVLAYAANVLPSVRLLRYLGVWVGFLSKAFILTFLVDLGVAGLLLLLEQVILVIKPMD